jgi:hypothetical protein
MNLMRCAALLAHRQVPSGEKQGTEQLTLSILGRAFD